MLTKVLFTFLGIFYAFQVSAQHTGNGGSLPWVVLDSKYDTSPFNDTTKVDVWFDG